MLTRKVLFLLTYANMKLHKDSNIAVHFSIVRCDELNCSFYSADSSKQNSFSNQNFSHISEKYIHQVLLVWFITVKTT